MHRRSVSSHLKIYIRVSVAVLSLEVFNSKSTYTLHIIAKFLILFYLYYISYSHAKHSLANRLFRVSKLQNVVLLHIVRVRCANYYCAIRSHFNAQDNLRIDCWIDKAQSAGARAFY